MLFQLDDFATHAGAAVAAVFQLDPAARIALDGEISQIDIDAPLTANQMLAAFEAAGVRANRATAPAQIHVAGGSTCCGSCG